MAIPPARPTAEEPVANADTGKRSEPERIVDRQRIVEALEQCAGNQTRAAQLLGISLRTLVNRLAEYNIARPRKRS